MIVACNVRLQWTLLALESGIIVERYQGFVNILLIEQVYYVLMLYMI